ncbi:MAG: pyruvate dehydrogenase (acetyl-transferring) E1 component subunit alpha [Anaerolineae bacterium]|nr:pyruvate dehydrogenase (acetyl-transferring) E1 component subunit alpha [Anaerolineae bacterium]
MESQSITVEREKLLDWYRQIVLIRRFEERSLELYHEKKIGGVYLHLYNGQEATGVGAVAALQTQDNVITAYRDHGIAIAKGIDPKYVMAEMFGKKTGVSGGKGGSMHIASAEHRMWGGYAIVGGHLPIAAGIAIKARYLHLDEVTLCFVGDGASNNGYFHEALNLSAVWNLPVIWLIENNMYGMGTAVERASGQVELHKRAVGYGMEDGGRIDGMDVTVVYDTVKQARDFVIKNGPILIESMTYRYEGHGVSDKIFSERAQEMAKWRDRDPIEVLTTHLEKLFGAEIQPELERIRLNVEHEVHEAIEFADQSPAPTYEDLFRNVYVE